MSQENESSNSKPAERIEDHLLKFLSLLSDRLVEARQTSEQGVTRSTETIQAIVSEAATSVRDANTHITQAMTRSPNTSNSIEILNALLSRHDRLGRETMLTITHLTESLWDLLTSVELMRLTSLENAGKTSVADLYQHINSFSNEIRQHRDKVNKLIEEMRSQLTPIIQTSQLVTEQLDKLRGEIFSERKSAYESIGRATDTIGDYLSTLVQRSVEAVSHLQFQDPMIQNLEELERRFVDLLKLLEGHFSLDIGEVQAKSLPRLGDNLVCSEEDAAEHSVSEGETLLF